MVVEFGVFIGELLTKMYPNTFFLAFMAVVLITTILIKTKQDMAVVLMVSFMTFALIAGGGVLYGMPGTISVISTVFFPVLVLVVLIIGAVIAYALWHSLGY